MVTADELATRRDEIAASADLRALLVRLTERAAPVLARLPPIPEVKALLSTDGGLCPADGAALAFDPWSPDAHRCPRCGKSYAGERHHRHWARYQHLWLAERAAHLAALTALGGHEAAGARAREILAAYSARYFCYPNRDNVLGPSRLFFSTYLESIWICNYLVAAVLLREAGHLDDATARAVGQVADEAANLIGEFDEWFSNRQTWNNAALVAIAVWFEDEELAARALEGPSGLLAHLLRGYGQDGMWYEGENYHLFALRGLLTGAGWARHAGVDFFQEPKLAARVRAGLRAPAVTALPDFTFPARKDARFGVSLAQPMDLELWEIGLANLGKGEGGRGKGELASWLAALYRAPAPEPELFESYLHDAPIEPVPRPPSRRDLSWWALLEMAPQLAEHAEPWAPEHELLESQGLAVLRAGGRYVSLECGPSGAGGGHGHPDRLHLTLHADGVHWLPDFGTGSYVARDLFLYRSTLAHNAPRWDGASQPLAGVAGACEMFDAQGDWAWARGRCGDVTRTVVSGPAYVLDVVELAGREAHTLELPWHFAGRAEVETPGRWDAGELSDEFVTQVERFSPDAQGPVVLETEAGGCRLTAHLLFSGEFLRASGPGRPGSGKREPFYLVRARSRNPVFVTALACAKGESVVRALRARGDLIEIETREGVDRHHAEAEGWSIETAAGRVRLRGRREPEPPFEPILELDRPAPVVGAALRVDAAPALDGSLAGFDTAEPLRLDLEDQYRRSEEPYPGPEEFSGVAYANWNDAGLYLGVEVTKPEPCFRPEDAPPLRLDNEPDDIHSDGLQVYLRDAAGEHIAGFLIVPATAGDTAAARGRPGAHRVSAVSGTQGAPGMVRGAWRRTETGYRVTLAIAAPGWAGEGGGGAHVGGQVGFDLIINEMLPGRERRAGQLVWSGGNGWVWLRGDRQDPERFGVLELVG